MPVRPLPPVLAEKARLELNEDTEKIEEHISVIKEWLNEQPHLKARTDDQWIVAFLRGCKYRHEQTKAKLELYYKMRSVAPDLYSVKYYDPKLMDVLDTGTVVILPKIEKPGDPKLLLLNPGKYDPKEFTIFDIMTAAGFMYQISCMEDDDFTVSGITIVVDMNGAGLRHFMQASLKQIRNLILVNQDAQPLRIKGIHYLNMSAFFVTVMNFIKKMFNEKIRKILNIHSNLETFHEHVSKDILPLEYGGTASNLRESIDYWKRKIHEYRPFFEEDLQFGVDETKRIPKDKTSAKAPAKED